MSASFNLHCRGRKLIFDITDYLSKGNDRLTLSVTAKDEQHATVLGEATLYLGLGQLRELRNTCSEALRARDPLSPEDQELRDAGEAFFNDKTAENCCRLVDAVRESYAARPRPEPIPDLIPDDLFPHQEDAVRFAGQAQGRINRNPAEQPVHVIELTNPGADILVQKVLDAKRETGDLIDDAHPEMGHVS